MLKAHRPAGASNAAAGRNRGALGPLVVLRQD